MKRKVSYLRLLLPCFLTAVLVLDGLMGYTAPDPFDGIEVVTQKAYAAEAPELETMAQTGKKVTGKGPAGSLGKADESGEYNDGVYTGSARGFGGTIRVEVTIKGGKIVKVRILSASGETPSYLARASAVTMRIVSKNSTNVDAVSGATYSSNGIIKAVRNALEKAKKKKKSGKKSAEPAEPAKPATPPKPAALTGGNWTDGVYTGEGDGFGGKLHVRVTITDGKITLIELLDNNDGPEYIGKAENGIFPEVIRKQGTDVDAVTGATFSSYGLIAAINDALSKAAGKTAGNDQSGGGSSGGAGGSGTDSGDGDAGFAYKDGTYTRTAVCARDGWFDYDINITLTVSDGSITSLSIYKGYDRTESEDDLEENDAYLNMAVNGYAGRSGMIRKILDAQTADVDTVTGATYSSNAIRGAVTDILSGIKTEKKEEEKDEPEEAEPAAGSDGGPADGAAAETAAPEAAGSDDTTPAEGADDGQTEEAAAAQNSDKDASASSDSGGQDETLEQPAEKPAQKAPEEDKDKKEQNTIPDPPPAETAAPAENTGADEESAG